MAGVDLGAVLGGVQQQNVQLQSSQAQMTQDYNQVNDQANAIVAATKQEGADEGAIATQQAQGLLAAQTATRNVASSYGGNPDDVSFLMTQLGQQYTQTEAARLQAEQVVQQKQSVSFTDDPLQWLSNKLTVNTDINNYNNLEEQSNDIYTHMQHINELNSDTAKSMIAIAQTQTAGTVAATADAAVQKTTIAAADASIKGFLYNAQGVKAVTDMGQQQVDNLVKGTDTVIAAGHLAVAQQQLGIMQEELGQKTVLYQQEVKDKQSADASDAQVAQYVNQGRASMGLQPLPPTKIFTMFKIGGEAGEALKQQFVSGSMGDAINKPIIAASPGTAARFLATNASPLGTQASNPAMAPVVALLSDSYQQARNPQTGAAMGVNPKDPATLDNAISTLVGAKVVGMASNIKAGDASNIFQAPPLTSLATVASVKSNPVFQKVLLPQVSTGLSKTDPDQILSLTAAAVQQGTLSITDASSGIAALFRSAVAVNTETKDYLRVGIGPQTTYNTTLQGGGSGLVFGSAAKVDMTKDAQVATALMHYIGMSNQNRVDAATEGRGSSLFGPAINPVQAAKAGATQ